MGIYLFLGGAVIARKTCCKIQYYVKQEEKKNGLTVLKWEQNTMIL